MCTISKKLFFVLIISSFALGCGGIETEESTINNKKVCTLKVNNVNLSEVVRELEEKANLKITIDNSVNRAKVIKTTIKKESWDDVLKRLCTKMGYRLREGERASSYIISK